MDNLTIRVAIPDDAAAIVDYMHSAVVESDNLLMGKGEFTLTVDEEREFLAKKQTETGSLYLVAELNGDIVGQLSFSSGHKPRTRHTGEFGMSVAQAHWGKGIGRALLNGLIDWANKHEHITKLKLTVRTDNIAAIKLYISCGFEFEGRLCREVCIDGEYADLYAMGLFC